MDDAMAEAVEGADAVLVCASEKYKASQNCKAEFQYSVAKQKEIIPVRVEKVELDGWLGFRLAQKIYYDQVHSDAALAQTVQEIIAKELQPRKIEPRRPAVAPTIVADAANASSTLAVPQAGVSGTPSIVTAPESADILAVLEAQLQTQQQSNQLFVQMFQQVQKHLQAQEQRHQEQMQAQERRHQEQMEAQERQMHLLLAALGRLSPGQSPITKASRHDTPPQKK
eukprot:TRINITY_DN1360_c0_g1_i1.p1 TRINITY_DN1360_c0_g1~~TRINITY_DN1360_c0_g1_i1.p1  ORF type:complete len:234 (+),score=52.01 TRINITY_DN1360_c0_g1_i1:27-704(+)